MTENGSTAYLRFLEEEFSRGQSHDDLTFGILNSALGEKEELTEVERWSRAASALEPRSRVSFIFGVTMRDIQRAAKYLAGEPELRGLPYIIKRLFDIITATIILIALLPLLLLLGIIIKADSPGPVIFGQQRVGKNGKVFTMYKFRTMAANADQQLAAVTDGFDSLGVLFKIRHDPRVTRPGRWMRRYSLDELPQFWNVLTGRLSLVGPRPVLVREAQKYPETARFRTTPGITGLWQISGRADLADGESVRLDQYYVENWSLRGDLIIIWRTVRAVTSLTEGAY